MRGSAFRAFWLSERGFDRSPSSFTISTNLLLDSGHEFPFYKTIFSCQEAEKVLIKIFNVNRQNFKSQSQIQLAKQDEHLQKTWLLDEKTKRRKKTAILISGWWFVQGKIIFHQKMERPSNTAPRNIQQRSLLRRDNGAATMPSLSSSSVLPCPIKAPQSLLFHCLFWRDTKSLFVSSMKKLKRYIHNISRVNKVSTKPDIWNFGNATKRFRFSWWHKPF